MVFKDNFLIVLLLTTVTVLVHSNGSEFEMHSSRLQEASQQGESVPLRTTAEASSPQVKAASRFWYAIKGEADHFREESRDENGVVHGTYGYRTPTGIMRLVRYVADAKGFRAGISSNEPGVSQMEPSSVRLYKFSLPPQRTHVNSIVRNPPLNFVSSPIRTHVWGTHTAQATPFRHNTNLYEDTTKYTPETAQGFQRNSIPKTKQTTGQFGSTISKNPFYTSVNAKDAGYGTQNLFNSYPKFHITRTTPHKVATPPTVLLDSRRLPPWKRTSLSKKNSGVINAGDSIDRVVSSNPVKENGEIIKESSVNCGKNCASKFYGAFQPGFNNSVEETHTNSYPSHSGIQEHLSHSFSFQEKLSAVRTVLQDYLSKDNTTLPQMAFAKKLLQFYDLNGIVPPHLLPNSISVPSYSKRTDAEVKALLDQIAESRWQYERNQQRYKKPWRNYDGLRDVHQPEYSPPLQYPKRPFIQVLTPIAVDIPEQLSHEKPLMNVPITSGDSSIKNEGTHFISNVPLSSQVSGDIDKNRPHMSESISTSKKKSDDETDSLRQFVLKHFLLGRYSSNQGIKSEEDNSDASFMSDNRNRLSISSSKTGSTEKDIFNNSEKSVDKSETSAELTTQENAAVLRKESLPAEEVESQVNSEVQCSQSSHDCPTKTEAQDSEGNLRTNLSSLGQKHVTSSLSPEYASTEYSGAFFSAPPRHPETASTVSRYWQDNSFFDLFHQRGDHRLFKIPSPERPVYDSRGQLVKPDAVPLHLHRFRPVKSSSPSSLGPFRFSIPRPVPPSSVIIPPKPPTLF